MSIITLTTDYGLKDHFVGALKGKYYHPQASIIDISHHIDPFNTVEASYIISAAIRVSLKDGHLIEWIWN
jgi:S-adenosylmethionine hydrolase